MSEAAIWREWNGRRLRWQMPVSGNLCIDGERFERLAAGAGERDFAFAPGGHAPLEFSLRDENDVAMSPPWRVLHGEPATCGMDAWHGAPRALQALADAPLPAPNASFAHATVVVPVYNSPQSVQRCITALLRFTGARARLILIDDASTDTAIAPLLARYAHRSGIRVLRNARNLGYSASCNRGIELAGSDDVVLLNADTQVGPRWLERLRLSAYADAAIGSVTAVSDNAGAFSVPELEQYCPLPSRWSLAQTQRALLQQCGGCLPQLPTGNGFCMYVKRTLFERVDLLDAAAFPAGYGEENDLCQRAERVGFRHVVAGDVLVQHERSASFGDERRVVLGKQGMAVLRQRYPEYEAKVGASLHSFARLVLDWRVRRLYAGTDGNYHASPPRPRVLLAGAREDEAASMRATLDDRFELRIAPDGEVEWRAELARDAIELVHLTQANAALRAAAHSLAIPVLALPANTPALAAHYRAAWRVHAAFAWDAAAAAVD